MPENWWESDPIVGAPGGPLPSPPKQAPVRDPLQIARDEAALKQAEREEREWNATHNPDGTPKPKSAIEGGKMIPEAAAKRTEGEVGTFTSLESSRTGFKDDYGGNPIGGLENLAQAFSPIPVGTPGQREWWAAFKATDNQIRNDLFGSALTAPEKAAYEATTVSPGMRPDIIRTNVTRRAEIIKGALERRRTFMIANGYKPEAVDALFAPILAQQEALEAGANAPQDDEAAGSAAPPPPPGMGSSPDSPTGSPPSPAGAAGTPPPGMPMNAAEAGNIPGGSGGGGEQIAQGDEKTTASPVLSGIIAEYRGRLAAGQSGDELVAYLQSVGQTDPKVLNAARAQAQYRARFPKVPIEDYDINALTDVPLSALERGVNAVVDNPVGAWAVKHGNALTANTLDSMVEATGGSGERTRLAIDELERRYPVASTIGAVTGGVHGMLLGEAGLAKAGVQAGLKRSFLADTAVGSASGAGAADDGNRLEGAAKGALVAGGGSLAGRAATSGISRAIAPSGGKVADLYASGVRPTPGQRFADSGVLGKAVNATEEALQSVPVVGAAISGARQEARDQFQVGAFNEALKEIGEQLPKGMKPGTDPHKFAQEAFNQVYSKARAGMQVVADQDMATDLAALGPDIATLGPQAQNRLKAILDNSVNNKLKNGQMNGASYKTASSDLGKHIARLKRSTMGEDMALADILTGVQDALDGSARRNSPLDAVALLDAADAGYSKLVRIEEAARRRGGDAGTFSPTNFDSAVQKTSGGVRSKAYLRGDAAMQDYAEQGKTLVDRMPNSGTSDRAMTAGAVLTAGAGYAEPTSLAVLGAIGAAYAPGVRRVVKGAIAPAGPGRKAIARQLQKRARLVGKATAATGVASLPGTSPGQ